VSIAPSHRTNDRSRIAWDWRDGALVIVMTLAVGLLSQRWTGLDTPDSGFYASLALFGSEVTDRAPETSYYWTRLGYIVPVQLITDLFGTWLGFAVWRMFLLLLIVASFFSVLRLFAGTWAAAALTTMATLSSAVLSYLGNTYLTGTVLAGLAVAIAAPLVGRRWPSALLAGVILGWLAMVNPYGAFLAGGLWLIMMATTTWLIRWRTFRDAAIAGVIAFAAGIATFVVFLLAGRVVFPAMDWLAVYVEWNAKVDYADFASDSAVWLTDISLLVPAMITVICVGLWLRDRRNTARQLAAILTTGVLVLAFAFAPYMAGITLEAPIYQVMVWPPMLLALALATTPALREWTRPAAGMAIAGIALIFAAGFISIVLPGLIGITLAILTAAVVIVFMPQQSRAPLALGLIILTLVSAALLQNSRRDIGLYYLSPYAWAFQSNPISAKVHTAVNTQEWVLANTSRSDTILLWVDGDWVNGDRDLYSVAAMQLWGENRVTLEPVLSEADIARLADIRPTVLALYGPSMDGIYRFWGSIPRELDPTAPTCYDFPWPTPERPVGHACLTRLQWPAAPAPM
jgi:hypothetical protein